MARNLGNKGSVTFRLRGQQDGPSSEQIREFAVAEWGKSVQQGLRLHTRLPDETGRFVSRVFEKISGNEMGIQAIESYVKGLPKRIQASLVLGQPAAAAA